MFNVIDGTKPVEKHWDVNLLKYFLRIATLQQNSFYGRTSDVVDRVATSPQDPCMERTSDVVDLESSNGIYLLLTVPKLLVLSMILIYTML